MCKEVSKVNHLLPSYQNKKNDATCPNSAGYVACGTMIPVSNPCMINDVTRVFYLNLTSIHSWRSVIGRSVGLIGTVGVKIKGL